MIHFQTLRLLLNKPRFLRIPKKITANRGNDP